MALNFKREPALTAIALVAPAAQLTVAFVVHDPQIQMLANGAAALLAGVLTAAVLRSERLVPAVLGLAQAVIAIGVQLGWNLTAERQAAVMAFVGVVVAAYVRTQVFAPVPSDVPRETPAELAERERQRRARTVSQQWTPRPNPLNMDALRRQAEYERSGPPPRRYDPYRDPEHPLFGQDSRGTGREVPGGDPDPAQIRHGEGPHDRDDPEEGR